MQDDDLVQEFLSESRENLSRVEQEILVLEQRPSDTETLASIFRSFHTVKGTCGFLGYEKLERIAHQAESLLSDLRDGKLRFSAALASLILEALDAVNRELDSIGATGQESTQEQGHLLLRLEAALTAEELPAAAESAEAAPFAEGQSAMNAGAATGAADTTVRIDVGLIDRLINQVGELVLVRNQVLQGGLSGGESGGDSKMTAHRLNQITTDLQEGIMRIRMQPIGGIWNKLPRVVRDLSSQLKKDIRLVTEGANTEMDRSILEAVKDPLTHIIRNACDHGVEMPERRVKMGKPRYGTITMRAYHDGGQVVVEITDDGKGLDPEKIRAKAVEKGLISAVAAHAMSDRDAVDLIFHAGFSTAATVTNISGRGVGMDVVRKNIQAIGGHVDVQSKVGKGTTLKIRIPLTLAIIPGLIVSSSGQSFVIPQANLVELIRLQDEQLRQLEPHPEGAVLRWRDRLIPAVDFPASLRLPRKRREAGDAAALAVLEAEGVRFALILDRILSTREIVVKPLGKQWKRLDWYAGATVLGDGSIALILDVPAFARRERVFSRAEGIQSSAIAAGGELTARAERRSFLLVGAGTLARIAVPLERVHRLEKIRRTQLEWTSGGWVVFYRNSVLMRVASLAAILGVAGEEALEREEISLFVVEHEGGLYGIAVDRVLDVQEDVVEVEEPAAHAGLVATLVLRGRATELLRLDYVLGAMNPLVESEAMA